MRPAVLSLIILGLWCAPLSGSAKSGKSLVALECAKKARTLARKKFGPKIEDAFTHESVVALKMYAFTLTEGKCTYTVTISKDGPYESCRLGAPVKEAEPIGCEEAKSP